MHPYFSSLTLSGLAMEGPMIPLVIVGLVGIAGVLITAIVLHFRNQERARWHETARLALDKGLPIPVRPDPDEDTSPAGRHRDRMGWVIGGLINIAVGVAMFFGITAIPGAQVARYFVGIPALVGVALILAAVIDAAFAPKDPPVR